MNKHEPDFKSRSKSPIAAASSTAPSNAGVPLVDNRAAPVAQLVKKHHDPAKKKYLASGVGQQQNVVAAAALAIKKASPVPISNKEAARLAKAQE